MPLIVKPEPDRDLYVEWSMVIDAPVDSFSRAALVGHLIETVRRHIGPEFEPYTDLHRYVADVVARIDRTGSSSLRPGMGQWEDTGFVVRNMDPEGWLPRDRLTAFIVRLAANEPHDDLLEPFEDD